MTQAFDSEPEKQCHQSCFTVGSSPTPSDSQLKYAFLLEASQPHVSLVEMPP
jgi:hypothetical protein